MPLKFERVKEPFKEHKLIEKSIFQELEQKRAPFFKPKEVPEKVLDRFWEKYVEHSLGFKKIDGRLKYYKVTPTVLGTVRNMGIGYLKDIANIYRLHQKIKPKTYILAPVEIIDVIKNPNDKLSCYILERIIPSIDGETFPSRLALQKRLVNNMQNKSGLTRGKLIDQIEFATAEFRENLEKNNMGFYDANPGNILISDYDKKTNKFIIHFIDLY